MTRFTEQRSDHLNFTCKSPTWASLESKPCNMTSKNASNAHPLCIFLFICCRYSNQSSRPTALETVGELSLTDDSILELKTKATHTKEVLEDFAQTQHCASYCDFDTPESSLFEKANSP